MTAVRSLLVVVALFTALIVQSTVLTRLPLPGATVDLLLVLVIALGMRFGVATGAVTGFAAGLAWDLVSPADGPVGGWALVYLLVGVIAGRVTHPDDRPALELLGIVAGLCALSVLLYAVLGWLLGDPRIDLAALLRTVPTAALYGALLAPFLLPLIQRIAPARNEGAWL